MSTRITPKLQRMMDLYASIIDAKQSKNEEETSKSLAKDMTAKNETSQAENKKDLTVNTTVKIKS